VAARPPVVRHLLVLGWELATTRTAVTAVVTIVTTAIVPAAAVVATVIAVLGRLPFNFGGLMLDLGRFLDDLGRRRSRLTGNWRVDDRRGRLSRSGGRGRLNSSVLMTKRRSGNLDRDQGSSGIGRTRRKDCDSGDVDSGLEA
jgi:hypothetical protein